MKERESERVFVWVAKWRGEDIIRGSFSTEAAIFVPSRLRHFRSNPDCIYSIQRILYESNRDRVCI